MLIAWLINGIMWTWKEFDKRSRKEILEPSDRFPEFSKSLVSFSLLCNHIPLAIGWNFFCGEDCKYRGIFRGRLQIYICFFIAMYACAKGGFPERLFQGNAFDLVGHSHQVWHLISAVGMMYLADNFIDQYLIYAEYGCSQA
jgi:hypothetical protein